MVVPPESQLDGNPAGPPNFRSLTWRDLINSCWKDADYKRVAMARLVKAVYMLELDRQENRTQEKALAPSWWMPLKYKLTHKLIDKRDGSIFGAIFEWDRSAALADFIPNRPNGAPKAVLALRGTLLRSHTGRRDIEDDIRFAAWESLKGSFRFKETLEALLSVSDKHGSRNVCIAGHSLGAGFGLQVGKELAKEGINVEAHLFNPPSVSLAMNIGYIGEKAEYVWNGLKSVFASGNELQGSNDVHKTYGISVKRFKRRLSSMMDAGFGVGNRVPHLYINSNDYISCLYFYTDGTREITDNENMVPADGENVAKLFVVSKKNQEFLEAHSLKQWLSSDAELEQDIHNCKLMSKQLTSLNIATPSLLIFLLYPHFVSFATSHINIRETTDYVWNILKSVPLSSGKAQVSNDGDNTFGVGLKGWIPQFSRLKDASFWVVKCLSYLNVYNKNDDTREKMIEENKDPTNRQLRAKWFVDSKEKQEFLAAHGLEQWWPSDAELVQTIHDREHIRGKHMHLYTSTHWEATHLLNPPFVTLALNLSNIGERQEFIWKWNILKSMLPLSNDGDNTFGVGLKGWTSQFSRLKDASFWVVKCVSYLNVYNKNGGTREKMIEENKDPTNRQLREKWFVDSKEKQEFLAAHGLEQWWPSDAELVQTIHDREHIRGKLRHLYTSTHWEATHLLNPPFVTLAMNLSIIEERQEFIWKWNILKSMLPSSSETQGSISNDRDKSSEVELKSWIPQLSSLKDAGFAVGRWVPHMYSNSSDYVSRQLRSLYSSTPSQVSHLFNLPSIVPDMSYRNTRKEVGFVCETQDGNDKISGTDLKSWIPQLSGLKDTGFGVSNWISQLYARKSNDTVEKMDDMENIGPSHVAQGKPS